MTRLTGIREIAGLPIGIFDTERGYDHAPGYVIHREDRERIIGRVFRERHTYRTKFAGKRYGYDRTHWCWSAQPISMEAPFLAGRTETCYGTREEAIGALVARSTR